jgi:hypothetical protein
MPKSKHRKKHKQKVVARRNRIEQERIRAKKQQQMLIEQLIEQEKNAGAFDNNKNVGPDLGMTEGPQI